MTMLLDVVRRHADAHAGEDGVAPTLIPGLATVRQVRPDVMSHTVSRPLVALVVQGAKHVAMGAHGVSFAAGDTLLIAADVPLVSQITRASVAAPYYSLILELDPAIISALSLDMQAVEAEDDMPVRVTRTEEEVADTALRLMRLLERPASRPILQDQALREMHYWLLAGRHGPAIRRLGVPDSHARRIARAVSLLRANYAQALPVERLSETAGMSASSFHQHFKAITTLSPLQFQKQLRLIEARRMMMFGGAAASSAAFAVGYESVSQFTREYSRFFGLPPVRDIRAMQEGVSVSSAG